MSPLNKLPPKVRTAYSDLLDRFADACTTSDFTSPAIHQVPEYDAAQNSVSHNLYIHTSGRTRRNVLKIFIHCQEVIQLKGKHVSPELKKSTVRIYYYTINDCSADLMHSVHYDYDMIEIGPVGGNSTAGKRKGDYHPIFHAQICNEHINLTEDFLKAQLNFDFCINLQDKPRCYRESRIPTSDMTLPSVLVCLAADHLMPGFKDFIKAALTIQEKLPHPDYASTQSCIRQDTTGSLRSSHWYAHQFAYH